MLKKLAIKNQVENDFPMVALGKEKDTMFIHSNQVCDLLKRVIQKDLFDEIFGEMVFNQLDQIDTAPQKSQQTVSNFLKNTFAAIKPGGSLRIKVEQQTDMGIFNTHLQKTGFANIEVQKTEDAI